MTAIEERLAAFDAKKSLGMKMGTARLAAVLERAGADLSRLRFVHIAGTNGKGSTAAMIASILRAAGYRVGMFVSPSIGGFLSDGTVDGEPISKAAFADAVGALLDAEDKNDPLSWFEAQTGAVLLHFARVAPDWCVVECGLGGKDDATNVIPSPVAAVLTPIAADHIDILGKTLTDITRAKCGIIKPPCTVVTTPEQPAEALAEILRVCAARGLSVQMPAVAAVTRQTKATISVSLAGREVVLGSGNRAQAQNAALAVQTVLALREKGAAVQDSAIEAGLASAEFPCRQEWVKDNRLLDGGHNPAAVGALAASLREWGVRDAVLLTGMLADKDTESCVSMLAPFFRRVICTAPQSRRALAAERLAEQYRRLGVDAMVEDDPEKALTLAEQETGDGVMVVAGSFYLCAPLREKIKK